MNEAKNGPIQRKGLFLWQEDTPSGAGLNLWSGLLSANNGYSGEHALKAAMLFEAAPELLEALIELKQLLDIACSIGAVPSPAANGPAARALAAIRKATGG